MARFLKNRSISKGQVPGTPILIGRKKMDIVEIHLFQFNCDSMVEEKCENIDKTLEMISEKQVNWINFYGIHDTDIIKKIGEKFNLHSILQEDIMNTDIMPKYVPGDDYDAIILKMLNYNDEQNNISAEQISLLLGENYLVTLQEQKGDVFNLVRDRIRNNKGRIRKSGNDYLAYALMDIIVDNYLILIEKIGRQIEDLEDTIFYSNDNSTAEKIYKFKMELNFLRKCVRPLKEIILNLIKTEDTFFTDITKTYLNNLKDQIDQAMESIELYSNILSDQLSMYHTNVNNKMNQVMKILTVFASIFIPLTFIAGVYGMNFKYIPELDYKYAYFVFWGITAIIGFSLFIYFKRKKWF